MAGTSPEGTVGNDAAVLPLCLLAEASRGVSDLRVAVSAVVATGMDGPGNIAAAFLPADGEVILPDVPILDEDETRLALPLSLATRACRARARFAACLGAAGPAEHPR